MSIQTIFARLVRAGMTPESACGMMGNMNEESAMRSNNAQDGLSPLSDDVYTNYADRGLIDFANDSIGYGLCQWTLASRKRKMLEFHRQRGVSIGDEDTQVDFCLWELQNEPEFRALWNWLCTNKGVAPAAERICREYERPEVNNYGPRNAAANNFYMMLSGIDLNQIDISAPPSPPAQSQPQSPEINQEIFFAPAAEQTIFWPPRVLDKGMFGGDVAALHGLLVAHGYNAPLSWTFDVKTRAMLMAFQAEHDLDPDGICGNQSWTALIAR